MSSCHVSWIGYLPMPWTIHLLKYAWKRVHKIFPLRLLQCGRQSHISSDWIIYDCLLLRVCPVQQILLHFWALNHNIHFFQADWFWTVRYSFFQFGKAMKFPREGYLFISAYAWVQGEKIMYASCKWSNNEQLKIPLHFSPLWSLWTHSTKHSFIFESFHFSFKRIKKCPTFS